MKVKSESEVAQSCRTLSDPMACSLPGPSGLGHFSLVRTGTTTVLTGSIEALPCGQQLLLPAVLSQPPLHMARLLLLLSRFSRV